MRRLLSFLSMAITIIAVIFLAVPTMVDTPNLGVEFNGGYEIVYEITDSDGQHDEKTTLEAAEAITKRIAIAGVENPNVEIEGENNEFVRVSLPVENTTELAQVQVLIESDGKITFTDSQGNIKMTGEEVLQETNGAVLSFQNGEPVVVLNISDTTLFGEVTGELAGQNMIIWVGYREASDDYVGDYDAAFNNKGSEADQAAAKEKILVNAQIESAITSSSATISGLFSEEEAASISKVLSLGTLDFNIVRREVFRTTGDYGTISFDRSALAGLVGIILVMAIMIIVYKIPGLVSCLTLGLYSVLSIIVFNLLGGRFGLDIIVAIIIGVGFAVDSGVILFERIRDELYKGRSVKSSYAEATKKSLSSIIDSSIVLLLMSLVLYFFGEGVVKGFATMLMINVILAIVITFLITRLLMWLVVKSTVLEKHKKLLAIKEDKIPNVVVGEAQTYFGKTANFNFVKKFKGFFISTTAVLILGIAATLVFGLVNNKPLNYGPDFANANTITIQITDTSRFDLSSLENEDGVVTEENVRIFLEDVLYPDETPTKVSVVNYNEKNDDKTISCLDIKITYKEDFAGLTSFEDDFRLELNMTSVSLDDYISISNTIAVPYHSNAIIKNALLSISIAILVAFVYVFIRFRFTYAFASLFTVLGNIVIFIALMAIFRIEVNTSFVPVLIASVCFLVTNMIIVFDRIREASNETNYGNVDKKLRAEVANKAIQTTFMRSLFVCLIPALLSLVLLVFGTTATLSYALSILVGMVVCFGFTVFVAPAMWLLVENVLKVKHKEKKSKATKTKKKSNDPEELTVIGIND